MLLDLRLWKPALLYDRLRQLEVDIRLRQKMANRLRWTHHNKLESGDFRRLVFDQLQKTIITEYG